MKHLIVPALSGLLLVGLAAPADASAPPAVQLARNDRGDEHHPRPGGIQPSPATVPAGAVFNPAAGSGPGRGHGSARTTGGPVGPTTGGANATPGHGPATAGGVFTGVPTGHGTGTRTIGGHAGGTVFGTRPRNWNQFPRTFDRGAYQRNITAPRRYRWQTYNRPHGWYYRRWTFGQVLPSIFWANDYWLNDYWRFGLPIPPYGYVWVRYGDDALLVNTRTGQVLQVVYGLFD